MKCRVLITPDDFRVSLPGSDAKLGELDKSTFDSRFSSIGLSIQGQVFVPSTGAKEVLFGKVYNVPPIFFFGWTSYDWGTRKYRLDRMFMPQIYNFVGQYPKLSLGVKAVVKKDRVRFFGYRDEVRSEKTMLVRWRALV